jgi:hypothetical protein
LVETCAEFVGQTRVKKIPSFVFTKDVIFSFIFYPKNLALARAL